MEEWKTYKLGNVCKIYGRIGFRGYTIEDLVEDSEKGAISLSPTNIQGGVLDLSKPTYISWEKYYESPEIMIHENDIVIVKTGSSIGRTAIIRNITHPMTLNPQLVVLKDVSINKHFLGYLVKGKDFQGKLSSIVVGSAIPTLSQKNLANLTIAIPPTRVQEKIANILSSLDSKIELNNRINHNLEEQAQALYKSWFVDFEPFKDGKFVESELGMIPEGWRVGTLSEVSSITMGQSPSGTSFNEAGNGIAFYQGRTEFGFRFPTTRLFTTEPARFAEQFSILLSVRAPVGDINIAKEKCCIGRGLASIHGKYQSFVFYTVESLKPVMNRFNGEGTVFGSINRKELEGLKIVVPPLTIQKEFNSITNIFDREIYNKSIESVTLCHLRDTLLPKLMSGELKINEIDC